MNLFNSFLLRFTLLVMGIFIVVPIAYSIQVVEESLLNKSLKDQGYIEFNTDADSFYVYLGTNYENPIHVTGNKIIPAPAGGYMVFVFGKNFDQRRFYPAITQSDTTKIQFDQSTVKVDGPFHPRSAYARLHWNSNLMIFTDRESTIYLNGNLVGNNGFAKLNLPAANYRIRVEHPSGLSREEVVEVDVFRMKQLNLHLKRDKKYAHYFSVVPGASQIYKRQHLKGGLLFALNLTASIITIKKGQKVLQEKENFYALLEDYQNASSEREALALAEQLEVQEQLVRDYEKKRNLFIVVTAIIYAANIYDAFRKPEIGFRSEEKIHPFSNFSVDLSGGGLSLTGKIEF